MNFVFKAFLYCIAGAIILLMIGNYIALQYKDEIMDAVKEEFNERIYGELRVKEMDYTFFEDFPNLSFRMVEPQITDTLYEFHQQHLFKADKINLQLSLLGLLNREIFIKSVILENSQVHLFKGKDGYSNFNIFKHDGQQDNGKAISPSGMEFKLDKVLLKQVAFSFVDSVNNKTIRFEILRLNTRIDNATAEPRYELTGAVNFNELTFKPEKGSFLKNTATDLVIRLTYKPTEKEVYIHPSDVEIDDEHYHLSGNLSFNGPPVINLSINTEAAKFNKVLPLLPEAISKKLKRFTVDKPLRASAKISTQLTAGYDPLLDVRFITEKATITFKGQKFTDVALHGRYFNQMDANKPQGSDNEAVTVADCSGKYAGVPFNANYTITRLQDPLINLASTVNFPLTQANQFLDESKMMLNKGQADIAFKYNGKVTRVLSGNYRELPGKLNGTITVKGGDFSYYPRQFQFSGINGSFHFNQSDVDLKALKFNLNNNAITVKGNLKEILPFLLYDAGKLSAEINVRSASFNFDDFKSPGTLEQMGLIKRSENKSATAKRLLASKLEVLLDKLECRLAVYVNEVKFRNFLASDVKGNVVINESTLALNNVSLYSSGGRFAIEGNIDNINQAIGKIQVHAAIEDADVRQLFHSFDNFKQNTLEEKHLKGKLNADVTFSSSFDQAYNIIPQSMQGKMFVQLKNGHLINFEPLSKMNKVIFKNRDFTDIEFADIKNDFELDGHDLKISRMEVASSVLNFFVQGLFSFKNATDLSIQLPLSNLKKRDEDFVPEKIGIHENAGASIYLRAKAETGSEKVKITYDPFKKGVKENKYQSTAEEHL